MSRKRRSFQEQRRIDQQMYYDDFHTKQYKLKLNKKTDEDIIKWIESKMSWNSDTSFQGEIKKLIREEIQKISERQE
jgi:hypothetical protein